MFGNIEFGSSWVCLRKFFIMIIDDVCACLNLLNFCESKLSHATKKEIIFFKPIFFFPQHNVRICHHDN